MEKKKKKIIIVSILVALLLLIVGTGYAFFYYERNGNTTSLALGDIYFHYRETDRVINIENAMPRKLIADDFISQKEVLNPIMKNQNLSDTNELTACVAFMEQGNMYTAADYTNVDLCRGTGKVDFSGQLLTFDEMLMYAPSIEGGPEMVQMLVVQNIVIQEDGNYKLNPILKTQEVNNLPLCVNTLETYISENSVSLESGETTEAFCRGMGTLEGKTFEEHKNTNSYLYEETIDWLIRSESVKIDKILQELDLPYFEFSVKGKNTYQDKNVEYEVVLNNSEYNGEDKTTRNERIDDKFLKFALVEVVGEEKKIIFINRSYEDLAKTTIFTDNITSSEGEIDKTYRLYTWIGDEVVIGGGDATYDYDMETWSNKIYASIRVDINADFISKNVVEVDYEPAEDSSSFKRLALNKGTTVIDTDGTVYLSGTNDDINYNYVWYSGKLWRITAINPDGSLKLITDDLITTIAWGKNTTYSESYARQWLNQEFLPTLHNYQNIIVTNAKWNVTATSSSNEKPAETTMVTDAVGLLNSYEYYKSYENIGTYDYGYLNIGYYWWLMNQRSASSVWYVYYDGDNAFYSYPSTAYSLRPSINLKSTIQLSEGSGTKTDPYRIKGDKEEIEPNTTLLNTRTSGEYVNFDGEKYRIIGIENGTTKINKVDYVRDDNDTVIEKSLASSIIFGLSTNTQNEDYWDYYLNNTWYNSITTNYKNMLEKGTYYLGKVGSDRNYKLAICATASNTVSTKECPKTSTTYSGYVGLPGYGEMFSSQLGSGYSTPSSMCSITPYDTSSVVYVRGDGYAYDVNPSNSNALRPSINLKSTIKITGGDGTENSPFEISL